MAKRESNWHRRGSSHSRGYGAQWQKLRKLVLARDDYLCAKCLEHGRVTPGNEVDHITPKAKGGTDDMDNLQTLCTPCHTIKTIKDNGATPKGCNANGVPIDDEHAWNRG
jgi:5-methylcytosine-specific restriction protein A